MGMFTEFLFQGETKANLPENVKELIDYFFHGHSHITKNPEPMIGHPFFNCDRWKHIGHAASYYFSPFSLRHKIEHIQKDGTERVFLLCNLKNYFNEIELFLNWIDPYMEFYWGHYWYEESDKPTFFTVRR